jgi:hypothetical protein
MKILASFFLVRCTRGRLKFKGAGSHAEEAEGREGGTFAEAEEAEEDERKEE